MKPQSAEPRLLFSAANMSPQVMGPWGSFLRLRMNLNAHVSRQSLVDSQRPGSSSSRQGHYDFSPV
jgi:hypothetical protein